MKNHPRCWSRIAPFALLGCAFFLYGCAPKPQVKPLATTALPAAVAPEAKFGSFNLQKRHGLGSWEGQSGPSEQQLLKQMSQNPQTAGTFKANPSQPGKESH